MRTNVFPVGSVCSRIPQLSQISMLSDVKLYAVNDGPPVPSFSTLQVFRHAARCWLVEQELDPVPAALPLRPGRHQRTDPQRIPPGQCRLQEPLISAGLCHLSEPVTLLVYGCRPSRYNLVHFCSVCMHDSPCTVPHSGSKQAKQVPVAPFLWGYWPSRHASANPPENADRKVPQFTKGY